MTREKLFTERMLNAMACADAAKDKTATFYYGDEWYKVIAPTETLSEAEQLKRCFKTCIKEI